MNRIARVLLAGAYITLLIYFAWPLFEDAHRNRINLVPATILIAFLFATLIEVPRWALLLMSALNALTSAAVLVALIVQSLTTGFSPLVVTDLPGFAFFLVFVPAVAAYAFLLEARRSKPAVVLPNPSLERP